MRGRMGVSNVPLGDLSVSDDPSDASVAAFLFSNSIALQNKKPSKTSNRILKKMGERAG